MLRDTTYIITLLRDSWVGLRVGIIPNFMYVFVLNSEQSCIITHKRYNR
jgi:hypothetical protein